MAHLAIALFAAGLTLHFTTVSKEDIERRLRSFENTNFKRELRLRSLFEEAGCKGDNLTEQRVKQAQAPNVICTLPGSTGSVIVVGAHFDFADIGEGVVDNWSGCSLLPSFFQSLKAFPRKHTYVFIGFTNEEEGLVGSKSYLHELGKEGRANIRAMVNFDSLGLTPTKIELRRADKKLSNGFATVAAGLKLPFSVVDVHEVGRSDSDSFEDAGIPTMSIHSVTTETFPILHSTRDRMSAIRLDDYYDTYLLLRVYLAYLDEL